MSDFVTIRGVVGTEPHLSITGKGSSMLKFRAATHERKLDEESGRWEDTATNWYSVTCFRTLAENAMESLRQGDHVLIHGKLQIRQFERADGTRGTSADVEAYALGHDLKFGASNFARNSHQGAVDQSGDGDEPGDGPVRIVKWPEGEEHAA